MALPHCHFLILAPMYNMALMNENNLSGGTVLWAYKLYLTVVKVKRKGIERKLGNDKRESITKRWRRHLGFWHHICVLMR